MMTKIMTKQAAALLMILGLLFSILPAVSTRAATATYRIYTISGGNTRVYKYSSLKSPIGIIFPTDELTLLSIENNGSCRVRYGITGTNRTKTGYIPKSAILTSTIGLTRYANSKVTTYRRPYGPTFGYIATNDKVTFLPSRNGYTQVIYPIGNRIYKIGWIRNSDTGKFRQQKNTGSNTNTSSSTWAYPMTNAYVCGNNWRSYYRARPQRPYHVGLDLASRTGDSRVFAAAGGRVAARGYNGANGYYVIIKHNLNGKNIYSFYCHLRTINVSNNTNVSKGTQIGIYGNTGSGSAGRHLHFAIVDNLWSGGSYYGYVGGFTGNKTTYGGVTYYNPTYVINNKRLP